MFDITIFDEYDSLSQKVAQRVARQILHDPECTLGLPTGETPKGLYRNLVDFYEQGLLDFHRMTTFNLDEFYPISPDHPKRFARYMDQHLFNHVNVNEENTHIPDGTVEAPQQEARQYEQRIAAAGGIDLQLLGIGENGHIGFNEPGSDWDSRTRVTSIAPETREKYSDAANPVPDRAITMGIRTIMNADQIILMASGRRKAKIIERALNGSIVNDVPASILKLHPDLSVCLDKAAAQFLDETQLPSGSETS